MPRGTRAHPAPDSGSGSAPPTTTSTDRSPASSSPTASCHCGRVSLALPSAPVKLNECQCSICYRYGALWAYYPSKDVEVSISDTPATAPTAGDEGMAGAEGDAGGEEGTSAYIRTDVTNRGGGKIGFFFCKHCGCMTHWMGVRKSAGMRKMGVNARMLRMEVIEGVERAVTTC